MKNLLNKEDATAMVVVTAARSLPRRTTSPLLLASAHHGSWKALNLLLEREDARRPPMVTPTQQFLELLGEGSKGRRIELAGASCW